MKIFDLSGIFSIGSRLRWLTDTVTRDAADIYKLYGIDIKPKWFPVLYMLLWGSESSVTGIAKAIGQTHPSVSNIIKELKSAGLAYDEKSKEDHRASIIKLTDKGAALKRPLDEVCNDVRSAVSSIEASSAHKLWQAIDNWEESLSESSLLSRVRSIRDVRHNKIVKVVNYTPEYLMTFKRLNIMWINSHWSLEAHDLEVLGDPDKHILSKGGHIFVALINEVPMGVVALCRMDNTEYDFELAKLAVDTEARGAGIGELLCRTAIKRAKQLGARKIFLESNTILKPAITLYGKLGFTELKEYHPAYERGNIQMELNI